MFILIRVNPVNSVIGRHDCMWISLFHRNLKCCQLNLPQRPLIHNRIRCHTAQFLRICRKMLRTCRYAKTLNAPDISGSHFSCQIRVLAKIFKIPPAQWRTLDVHPRLQQYFHILAGRFFSKTSAKLLAKLRVPGIRHSSRCRKTSRRHGTVQSKLVSRTFLLPYPMRPVSHSHVWNTKSFDTSGLPVNFLQNVSRSFQTALNKSHASAVRLYKSAASHSGLSPGRSVQSA